METPRPCRGVFLCPRTGCVRTGRRHDGARHDRRHPNAGDWQQLDAAASLDEIARPGNATYLGAKGEFTLFLRGLATLPAEERPIAGRGGNALKTELTAACERATCRARSRSDLDAAARRGRRRRHLARPPADSSARPSGLADDRRAERIFALLGFQTVFGPRSRPAHYNFDLLNIPSDHPARDVWDTIIVDLPGRDRAAHPHLADAGARHGADRSRRCA